MLHDEVRQPPSTKTGPEIEKSWRHTAKILDTAGQSSGIIYMYVYIYMYIYVYIYVEYM